MTEGANATQVGGDHYRTRAIQPWDFIAANGLDFFQGSAVKYIVRFREKGGVDDLRKARHYLDKLIELETARAGAGGAKEATKTPSTDSGVPSMEIKGVRYVEATGRPSLRCDGCAFEKVDCRDVWGVAARAFGRGCGEGRVIYIRAEDA